MRATSDKLSAARLYGIVDLNYLAEEDLEEAAESLLDGGVDVLQLRAKGRLLPEILKWARMLGPLCRDVGVPFIVNDYADLARASGADGVHLGQDDGPLAAARDALPPGFIIGRSTHSPAQAAAAVIEGADYIGFGPLFPTPTKPGRPAIGLENISEVEAGVGSKLPVFCIGGINSGNLGHVIEAGARRVVMVSELLQAKDIVERCREVKDLLVANQAD